MKTEQKARKIHYKDSNYIQYSGHFLVACKFGPIFKFCTNSIFPSKIHALSSCAIRFLFQGYHGSAP